MIRRRRWALAEFMEREEEALRADPERWGSARVVAHDGDRDRARLEIRRAARARGLRAVVTEIGSGHLYVQVRRK